MSSVQRVPSETAKTLLIRENIVELMTGMSSYHYATNLRLKNGEPFTVPMFNIVMRGYASVLARMLDQALNEEMYGRGPAHTIE